MIVFPGPSMMAGGQSASQSRRWGLTAGPALPALSFRAINRPAAPDYNPGLQRHHLLPQQLLAENCFARLFDSMGRARVGFDDFRRNGLLLPASDFAALRMGLPLHRGPRRAYNALVIARVGQIEARWSERRIKVPVGALEEALFRLGLLQQALRRRLLDPCRKPLALNRRDPAVGQADFAELDAMADMLWAETAEVQSESGPIRSASSILAA